MLLFIALESDSGHDDQEQGALANKSFSTFMHRSRFRVFFSMFLNVEFASWLSHTRYSNHIPMKRHLLK